MTYCYGWNELLREPRDPYREAVARRRHERGPLYTALFGDPKSPQSFVQVRLETEWIGLTVLDASLREWRMWSFDGAPANERFFEDLSATPPWGTDISPDITRLSEYFVTSDGRAVFGVLESALTDLEQSSEPLRVE